jgi:arginine/lysine/ornithine decarboxylase
MNLNNMPILKKMEEYMSKVYVPFHMPGHKENKRNFEELEFIRENLYKIDKTEVPGLDNLHVPEGMILKAQVLAAKAFKAEKSYFLVNGSTCGIYSMITGVTKPGDKIIVQRNCHRSIYMAAFVGQLEVSYINPEINEEFDIPAGLSLTSVIEAMEANQDAKAIVVTYPSYYGICSDLQAIISEAHKRNILVLVDEAHGAHLPFNDRLPKPSILLGGDASVVSVHKSLPALTQTSILNINKSVANSPLIDNIGFMLRLFQSTSPSYVLMASIDAARNIMERDGEKLLDELLENINEFELKIDQLKGFKLLDRKQLGKNSIANLDRTKIVINSKIGGVELATKLQQQFNIIVEMADIHNVVLIASVGDSKEYFDTLYQAIEKISEETNIAISQPTFGKAPEYIPYCSMREAYYSEKKNIRLTEAFNRISAEMIVPYPPGIPLILPGEKITLEMIQYIEILKNAGIQITGMEDTTSEYVKVLDKESSVF